MKEKQVDVMFLSRRAGLDPGRSSLVQRVAISFKTGGDLEVEDHATS